MQHRLRAVLLTVVGATFALGGLGFVVQRIASTWDETSAAIWGADPAWTVVAQATALLGMIAIALPWTQALRALGARVGAPTAVVLYFVGEIGKYLPGGVWPVVGRGELAARVGVRRSVAYASVLLSLATLYLAALLVAAVLLPATLNGSGSRAPALLILLVPVGAVVLHPSIMIAVIRMVARLTGRETAFRPPPWRTTMGLVLAYLPAWSLIAFSTYAVTRALHVDVGYKEVASATVLSWAAGFLIAPVPGGVGVREAVFVAVLPSDATGVVAAVALCARLAFMVADGVGAAVGAAVLTAGPGLSVAEEEG